MRRRVPGPIGVLLCIIVGFAILAAVPEQDQGPPPFPMIFSGTVSIQGEEAPEGLALVACVQDCASYETVEVITRPGGKYSILIIGPPNAAYLEKEISFWIVTEHGRIRATQTATYRPTIENLTPRLDLDFTDPVPVPPEPTPTPTPPPTPTPLPTPVLPIPGDTAVPDLSLIVLLAGIVILVAGGAVLFLVRHRRRAF